MTTQPKTSLLRHSLTLGTVLGIFATGALFAADTTDSMSSGTPRREGSYGTDASAEAARTSDLPASQTEGRENRFSQRADSTSVSNADKRFIQKAAKHGAEEVAAARLAVERTSDSRVRQFAQQLANDHERANAELAQLAARKGVDLSEKSPDHDHVKGLSDERGAKFDKKYIDQQVDGHKDVIDLFEKASRKSDDPEIAAWASQQLPELQQHLRTAQDLDKALD